MGFPFSIRVVGLIYIFDDRLDLGFSDALMHLKNVKEEKLNWLMDANGLHR